MASLSNSVISQWLIKLTRDWTGALWKKKKKRPCRGLRGKQSITFTLPLDQIQAGPPSPLLFKQNPTQAITTGSSEKDWFHLDAILTQTLRKSHQRHSRMLHWWKITSGYWQKMDCAAKLERLTTCAAYIPFTNQYCRCMTLEVLILLCIKRLHFMTETDHSFLDILIHHLSSVTN